MLAALCLSHTGDDTTESSECATTANAEKYCKNAEFHSQTVHFVQSRKNKHTDHFQEDIYFVCALKYIYKCEGTAKIVMHSLI